MDERLQDWKELHEYETKKKDWTEAERVYDFDIVLSLQSLPPSIGDKGRSHAYAVDNSDKLYRGTFRKTRAPDYRQNIEVGEEGTPGLQEYCQTYADCKSALKVFRVSRSMVGRKTAMVERELEPLIRCTHYRGHIDITFSVADNNVDIDSPHWTNRARLSWIRWIFYLTFLCIFTWPLLFFMTKRWKVYHARWYLSKVFHIGGEEQRRQVMRIDRGDE